MGILVENISKELELDVFERDSFTCQKCGKQVPHVVIVVQYKDPSGDKNNDNVTNFITSCYDCEGVAMVPGVDNIKRTQLEMMFNYISLKNDYKEDVSRMFVDYINDKISPFVVDRNCEMSIKQEIKNSKFTEILKVIDELYDKTIRYKKDKITSESAKQFIAKLPSYIVCAHKSPIEKKLLYIRGICRNNYKKKCNDKIAINLLHQYVEALQKKRYKEGNVLNDLDKWLEPKTIECPTWNEWTSLMKKWIYQINNWPDEEEPQEIGVDSLSEDEICSYASNDCRDVLSRVEILQYLFKGFPNYDSVKFDEFERDVCFLVYHFLKEQKDVLITKRKIDVKAIEEIIENRSYKLSPSNYFYLEHYEDVITSELTYNTRFLIYEEYFYSIIKDMLTTLNYMERSYDYPTVVGCVDFALRIFASKIRSIDFGEKFSL